MLIGLALRRMISFRIGTFLAFALVLIYAEDEVIKCPEGECVKLHLCRDGEINTDGTNLIDIRFNPDDPCEHYLLKCCKIPGGESEEIMEPPPSGGDIIPGPSPNDNSQTVTIGGGDVPPHGPHGGDGQGKGPDGQGKGPDGQGKGPDDHGKYYGTGQHGGGSFSSSFSNSYTYSSSNKYESNMQGQYQQWMGQNGQLMGGLFGGSNLGFGQPPMGSAQYGQYTMGGGQYGESGSTAGAFSGSSTGYGSGQTQGSYSGANSGSSSITSGDGKFVGSGSSAGSTSGSSTGHGSGQTQGSFSGANSGSSSITGGDGKLLGSGSSAGASSGSAIGHGGQTQGSFSGANDGSSSTTDGSGKFVGSESNVGASSGSFTGHGHGSGQNQGSFSGANAGSSSTTVGNGNLVGSGSSAGASSGSSTAHGGGQAQGSFSGANAGSSSTTGVDGMLVASGSSAGSSSGSSTVHVGGQMQGSSSGANSGSSNTTGGNGNLVASGSNAGSSSGSSTGHGSGQSQGSFSGANSGSSSTTAGNGNHVASGSNAGSSSGSSTVHGGSNAGALSGSSSGHGSGQNQGSISGTNSGSSSTTGGNGNLLGSGSSAGASSGPSTGLSGGQTQFTAGDGKLVGSGSNTGSSFGSSTGQGGEQTQGSLGGSHLGSSSTSGGDGKLVGSGPGVSSDGQTQGSYGGSNLSSSGSTTTHGGGQTQGPLGGSNLGSSSATGGDRKLIGSGPGAGVSSGSSTVHGGGVNTGGSSSTGGKLVGSGSSAGVSSGSQGHGAVSGQTSGSGSGIVPGSVAGGTHTGLPGSGNVVNSGNFPHYTSGSSVQPNVIGVTKDQTKDTSIAGSAGGISQGQSTSQSTGQVGHGHQGGGSSGTGYQHTQHAGNAHNEQYTEKHSSGYGYKYNKTVGGGYGNSHNNGVTVNPIIPPHDNVGCGVRHSDGVGFRITGDNDGESQYGEFPWMVAILKEEKALDQVINVYQCGGSLIHPQVVLTAAHCVQNKQPESIKVRLGEWDTQTTNEIYDHQDRNVVDMVVHDKFYKGGLFNDVALLFLEKPAEFIETVNTICLPPQDFNFDMNRCFASGWGKDVFGKEGKYQVILKKIELPVMPFAQCQTALRTTRLGKRFILNKSFICAGGEAGRDTCKGDGGSPLVCPIPGTENRYYQAGIVAWGIGCGETGIPGVYVNVAGVRSWIDEHLTQRSIPHNYYIHRRRDPFLRIRAGLQATGQQFLLRLGCANASFMYGSRCTSVIFLKAAAPWRITSTGCIPQLRLRNSRRKFMYELRDFLPGRLVGHAPFLPQFMLDVDLESTCNKRMLRRHLRDKLERWKLVVMDLSFTRSILLVGLSLSLFLSSAYSANSTLYPAGYENIACQLPGDEGGVCVFAYLCPNGLINVDGVGLIDLRVGDACEDYFMKCCSKETSCADGIGQCVPGTKCGVKLHTTQYRLFRQSNECDSDDYVCCPKDKVGKTPQNSSVPTTDHEICDEKSSICVPDDQCLVNTDGVAIIEERMGGCNTLHHTCCPRDKIKMPTSDACGLIGGKCVPTKDCSNPIYVDIRVQSCESGFVCCSESTDTSNENSSSTTEGKACFQGLGRCAKSCDGTKYRDRRNECEGLICCGKVDQPKNTTEAPRTEVPRTDAPITESPVTVTESYLCTDAGGQCTQRENCVRSSKSDFVQCSGKQEVCCMELKPAPGGNGDDEDGSKPPKPIQPDYITRGCGFRNEGGIRFKTVGGIDGESQYGEFPWMVALFSTSDTTNKYICGGTLIDPEVVLTTASCVKAYRSRPGKLIVRAGEWDLGTTKEPLPHEERGVRLVRTHPAFKPTSLVNNVALLFLDDKFDLKDTIDTVCLPPQDFTIDNGYVVAIGWGSTPKNQVKYQQVLKSIELLFNQREECEIVLRRATGKPSFALDKSFLCAGGELNVDTCRGDAGSPIMFSIPNDFDFRMYAVGMVSWGVGCGRPGIPAAYTDVAKFRDWIDNQMREVGLEVYYYQYDSQPRNDDVDTM
ncbi:uncharacterized protein LOC129766127 [Toxorhynchites rutilus septentrionalis]|uniref:uncharacterized protein LOC129766127 n=1 Tax=Toxorhynchites rutilus septentrionalis TaxID=329112 RepID=UPI00247AAB0D|nr:uncharacterized protein LOC129766127 [Toxorhynchites rutilus septentrionalis]